MSRPWAQPMSSATSMATPIPMNIGYPILDEPTRGIDVGAKAEIYRQIADLAAGGITILLVSSEMEEIIGMSDRVVVMHERCIRGTLDRSELTQESIASLMTGKKPHKAA